MIFKLEINMDNAAFMHHKTNRPSWMEVNRILHNTSMDLGGEVLCPDKGIIRDTNGNKVGTWEVTE